ncbi:MAG TPA: right-handed parallel beta-helix repeat-containing protein [Polyangiaceae bacterium]|nr:right-handed parallel beta-helix repeat-containing protein [Polyangiaceae bacterium]
MIDSIHDGITPWMYRIHLRVWVTAIALGTVVACGSDGGDSHGWPDAGGSDTGVTAGAGGSPTTPVPTAGTAPSAAGSANPSGGTSAQGGASNPTAGTGNPTAGSTSTAGTTGAAGAGSGNEFWIATDGNDSNPGTEAAPLKTLNAALLKVKAGVTLWVKPGTYPSGVTMDVVFKYSGTAAAPVKLFAAPGGRPVLDYSSQPRGVDDGRGINLVANYWHIKGLEIIKASDNCIAISGSNNTIEDVITHECGDTGIQITAPSSQATDQTRAANNTILNCDSWGNLDTATGGENADGFAAKLRIGPGNVFRGCRAWNNADDGWDLFAADDVVKIENSWAFSNGKPIGGSNPQGDGNGFKLGGAPGGAGEGGAVHLVSNSFGFENKACGFVRNNNPETPKLTGCGAKSNGKDAYCSLTNSGEVTMSMSASAAIAAKRNADGSLPKP